MNATRRVHAPHATRLVAAATLVMGIIASSAEAHAQSSNAASAPGGSIAMPESGSAAAANALALAEVDPSTGVLRAAYPFTLETPRGHLKLSLGLDYSSAAGVGYAGYGWDLRTEEIHRINPSGDAGAPIYSTPGDSPAPWDRFAFGDTQLVPICVIGSSATGASCALQGGESLPPWATSGWIYFRAEVEEDFARFFLSPNRHTWVVEYKDGQTLQLGAPLDDQADTTGIDFDGKQIYQWNIVRRLDEMGELNEVVYQWSQLGSRHIGFLVDVFDTPAPTGGDFAHRTHFDYETPGNLTSSFAPRWRATPDLQLKTVTITSATISAQSRELVRRYHLTYEEGDNTTFGYFSLLTTAQLEGNCPGQTISEDTALLTPGPTCYELPPSTFDYYDNFQSAQGALAGAHSPNPASNPIIVDFNSDGLPDFVTPASDPSKPQNLYINSALTGSSGSLNLTTLTLDPQHLGPTTTHDFLTYNSVGHRWANIGNWLGDGNINVLWTDTAQDCTVYSAVMNGTMGIWSGSTTDCLARDLHISSTGYNNGTAFGDLNGDGLVDVTNCAASATYPRTSALSSRDSLGTIQPFAASATTTVANHVSCLAPQAYPPNQPFSSFIVDMNGDAQADLVNFETFAAFGNPVIFTEVFNGLGDGTFSNDPYDPTDQDASTSWNSGHYPVKHPGQLIFDDVSGDGFADLAYFDDDGVEVYLGEPGTYGGTQFSKTNVGFSVRETLHTWDPTTCSLRTADMFGLGSDDIVVLCPEWGGLAMADVISFDTPFVPRRRLRSLTNGLGASTTISYESTAQLGLAATASGAQWQLNSPQPSFAVTRIQTRNNLPGAKEEVHGEEYTYRDPVYDGDEARFRGFRQVTTVPFSATSDGATLPSVTTHYLVGSCEADLHESCAGQGDPPLDALRGLPQLIETFVPSGGEMAYASTRYVSYELRKLYAGLDGRFVRFASVQESDTFLYDTTPFVAELGSPVLVPGINAVDDSTLSQPGFVQTRAAYSQIRSRQELDDFGNVTDTWNDGDVTASPADATIAAHNVWVAYGADSWWWRSVSTVVAAQGGALPGGRAIAIGYNSFGRLSTVLAGLSGSLPLERFHEDPTQATAPELATASVDGLVSLGSVSYDGFGNVSHGTLPDGGCFDRTYDPLYAQFPVATTAYVGSAGQNGCGSTALTTATVFDRGFEEVKMTTAPTGAVSFATYDGLGRTLTVTRPGSASGASITIDYPDPPSGSVVRLTHISEAVGDIAGSALSSWIYTDGLGRDVLTISQADTSAGDAAPWIASGLPDRDGMGQVVRTYLPGAYAGDPTQYPLAQSVSVFSNQATYEPFGRLAGTYDIDGTQVGRAGYHALSIDSWDPRQIATGMPPTTYTRDGHGRISSISRLPKPDGLQQQFTYDALGDLLSVSQIHTGTSDPPVTRWMQYDSLGRMVMNAEANTSVGFSATPSNAAGMKAWRYAYDDAGRLVGTSDARGCGENFAYDSGGRPLYEDYSPCLTSQAPYTSPTLIGDTPTGDGTEGFNVYDAPEAGQTSDYGGNPSYLVGQLVASYDRASHTRYAYDVRGRVSGVARQIAHGVSGAQLTVRYTPWWYRRATTYDGLDRPVLTDTGADVAELAGTDGASTIHTTYTARGIIAQVAGSYGTLLQSQTFTPDGFMTSEIFGDLAGTTGNFTPNSRRWVGEASFTRTSPALWSHPTSGYVPPTASQTSLQAVLADWVFSYGPTGEPTAIKDNRMAGEWPDDSGAKPVSRGMGYDSLGRLQGVSYSYATATSTDAFVSPLAAEAQSGDTDVLPFASTPNRVVTQTYHYDWLGNMDLSLDNVADYWDRSIGTITQGTATTGPNQLVHAQTAGSGSIDAAYDGAGNTVSLGVVRGSCTTGAICAYRFVYDWDEVGQLARARRWDFNSAAAVQTYPYPALPPQTANVDLSYSYDGGGSRVLKVVTSADGTESTSAEIFASLRLDDASFDPNAGDYIRSATTESVYLASPAGTLGRVVYDPSLPSTGSALHVFLEIGDHLGSATTVIDQATSELVERITYQAYGATESDYRPARWASYREAYRFTGKEDDVDVGLTYFGKRYYSPAIGRWLSTDPLAIHGLGADINPYSYVVDSPLAHVDPTGLGGATETSDPPPPADDGDGTDGDGADGSGSGQESGGYNPGSPHNTPLSIKSGVVRDGLGTITITNNLSRPGRRIFASQGGCNGGCGRLIPSSSFDIWMSGTPEVDVAEFFIGVEVIIGTLGTSGLTASGGLTLSNRLMMMAAMDQMGRSLATTGTIDAHTQLMAMGAVLPALGKVGPLTLDALGLLEEELPQLGGAFRSVRSAATAAGLGGEVHRLPSFSSLSSGGAGLSYGRAPAIWMTTADHAETLSHGAQGLAGVNYRAAQQTLIENGQFLDALKMDVDSIRALHGSRYDGAIQQMSEYLWQ